MKTSKQTNNNKNLLHNSNSFLFYSKCFCTVVYINKKYNYIVNNLSIT